MGRPLLAAKGAVAQVPTQWSGGGAAWLVAAKAVSAKQQKQAGEARVCGHGSLSTSKEIFSRTILRRLCRLPPVEGSPG